MKKILAVLLSAVMVITTFCAVPFSAATPKVSLNQKSVTLRISKKNKKTVYGQTTLKVKKAKGVTLKKITCKSANKKVVTVTKNGKLTAKKKGSTKVTVSVKYKYKKHTYTKTLTCKVNVKDARSKTVPKETTIVKNTNVTEETEPIVHPSPQPSSAPTQTQTEPETQTFLQYSQPTEPQIPTQPEATTVPNTSEPQILPTEPQPTLPYEKVQSKSSELNSVPETDEQSGRITDKAFLKKLSAFSNKLYAMSAKAKKDNYVMSPISVYMALSMLYSIGDEGVKSDIEELVNMDSADLAKTGELFNALSYKYYDFNDTPVSQINLTNSIWLNEGDNFNQAALDKLATEQYCSAIETPFAADNQAANKAVREFIKEKTNGLIDADFDLKPSTLFALINTLYFKDIWEQPLRTEKRSFSSSTDGEIDSEFLIADYIKGNIQQTDTADFFYTETSSGNKIKLILPKDGYTVKDAMNSADLQKVNTCTDFKPLDSSSGTPTEIYTRCIFPKFKIACDTPLKDIFESNNLLQKAFAGYRSPLVENRELCVSEIKHKAVIDVNKDGVEGAAVTIITSKATAIMPEYPRKYKNFILDRDFGFIITDRNNVILFEGQVTNPNS